MILMVWRAGGHREGPQKGGCLVLGLFEVFAALLGGETWGAREESLGQVSWSQKDIPKTVIRSYCVEALHGLLMLLAFEAGCSGKRVCAFPTHAPLCPPKMSSPDTLALAYHLCSANIWRPLCLIDHHSPWQAPVDPGPVTLSI